MVKQLRKTHLRTWFAMLILIPLGIVAATLAIPKQHKNTILQPSSSVPLPAIIKTVEKENYIANLRGNAQIPTQLEWINKKILTFPTAVIYKTSPAGKNINTADQIGRIEATGTYHFNLKNDSTNEYHFVLYDFIHQQIIDSINF